MPKNNYPNVAANDLPTEFVSDSIDSLQALAAMGKITGDTSQDAEFEERIAKIINFCKDRGLRPGVETVCAGLGITRTTLWDWEKNTYGNISERRQTAVKQLKQLIFAFLEQSGMSGKIPPVSYIWLSKNWMKYTDNLPVEAEENNVKPTRSRAEIAARYAHVLDEPGMERPEL